MDNKPAIALFTFGYLINVPPPQQEALTDNEDILLKWTSLGWGTMPGSGHTDDTARNGFYSVPGLSICIDDFVYMHRWVNIKSPAAGAWLENYPWNYDRNLVGWMHEIVFRNGWKLVTASQHAFDKLWSPEIAGNRIAILENSAVNLEHVSKVTSFKTNLSDYVEYLAKDEA